jgi:uncharacterized membrane protein
LQEQTTKAMIPGLAKGDRSPPLSVSRPLMILMWKDITMQTVSVERKQKSLLIVRDKHVTLFFRSFVPQDAWSMPC